MSRSRLEGSFRRESKGGNRQNLWQNTPLIDGTGPVEEAIAYSPSAGREAGRAGVIAAMAIAGLMIAGSLLLIATIDMDDIGAIARQPIANSSLSPHDPIHIDSDAEFAAIASIEGWQGDGSEGDPYLIEGYEIDATGHKQAVFIGNNTVHFRISGCHLSGAVESGVQLLNSTNATLVDNQCVSNVWNGIAIVDSHLVNATNNSCVGSHYGILVHSCYLGRLANNNCTSNGDGILVRYSSEIEIVENTCGDSSGDSVSDFGDGIRLEESDQNVISNNSCTTNLRYQIRLEHCDDNLLEDDVVNDLSTPSYEEGLYLYCSNHNVITGITHSPTTPIDLEQSSHNEISGCLGGTIRLTLQSDWNTVSDSRCTQGILLSQSSNNTISSNNCSYARKGIELWNSHDNLVSNNSCILNRGAYISMMNRPAGYGILCWYDSSRNTISGNNCSHTMFNGGNNAYGISASGTGNILIYNVVAHSEQFGMVANGADQVIRNNTIESNDFRGLTVSAEGGAVVIENNSVRFNQNGGIRVSGDGAMVVGNIVESNHGLGIESDSSSTGNTFLENRMTNDGIFPDSEFEWADTSNTVNGKPVYHLRSQNGGTVPSGAGQVILYQCTDVTVEGQDILMADVGIKLEQSTSCIVRNNRCNVQTVGVWLYSSSSNTIQGNNISGNHENGLKLELSNGNMIMENGIFDNQGYGMRVSGNGNMIWNNTFARNNGAGSTYDPLHVQAYTIGTDNHWNSSTVGNYWSDWTSPDINYDGIVDVPYSIATGSGTPKDYFPRTTPTVIIPVVPIPEFAPAGLAMLIVVLVIGVAALRRIPRRRG